MTGQSARKNEFLKISIKRKLRKKPAPPLGKADERSVGGSPSRSIIEAIKMAFIVGDEGDVPVTPAIGRVKKETGRTLPARPDDRAPQGHGRWNEKNRCCQ